MASARSFRDGLVSLEPVVSRKRGAVSRGWSALSGSFYMDQIMLFVTHVWNPGIAAAFDAWRASAHRCGIKVLVLYQSEVPNASMDPSVPVQYVKLSEIKALYPDKSSCATAAASASAAGVKIPWIWSSSHWIFMWWWKHVGQHAGYDNVWVVEYDVRHVGNLDLLWTAVDDDVDYVHTNRMEVVPECDKWIKASSPALKEACKEYRSAYKQVIRLSKSALNYLDACFAQGLNGQDERAIATLLWNAGKGGGFKAEGNGSLLAPPFRFASLAPLLCAGWTWEAAAIPRIKQAWLAAKSSEDPTARPTLFHPIKD